jgi:ribosomal protein S18 acetylase RimI-like enzyme
MSPILMLSWRENVSNLPLCIRPARLDDRGSINQLLDQLGYAQVDSGEARENFAAVVHHPEIAILVAVTANEKVIGFLCLSHRPQLRLGGRIASIDELVVAEAYRGCGIGSALMASARRIARELGVRRLELQTHRARESYRRAFYAKNGFDEVNSAVMRMVLPET